MKSLFSAFLLLTLITSRGQQSPEAAVELAINDFFEAFHARDSALLREMVSSEIRMQTIGRGSSGSDSVLTVPFGNFLRSIASIPDTVRFEEKLKSISVKVDGNLAQAWTPYEFLVDGKMSHCGVNAFQLFRDKGTWRILHIVDTRKREGCGQ